jgi:aspartate carbamoyltransferase catalytic subunit
MTQRRIAPAPRAEAPAPTAWRQRHLLDLDTVSRDELLLVMETARRMEAIVREPVKKASDLRGRTVLTLFYEASTRTRVSFEMAGKLLSADVINITAQGSSAQKGESLVDTALTLQAMAADALVVRHPHSGAPYLIARHMERTAVINAGDGSHAHPTQALLDVYTAMQRLGSLEGRTVAMVGDAAHSRVARSDLWAFAALGARVVLCGPPTLMPWDMLKDSKDNPSHPFRHVKVEHDLPKAVAGADVVMALRLQQERQQSGLIPSLREYAARWQVNAAAMALARPRALLMHPGPMNEGIEISSDVAHGAQSVIEQQVTSGLAVRMALLKLMLGQQSGVAV